MWALNSADLTEYLSTGHTRRMTRRLMPTEGDTFYSNRRTPLLLMEHDSSPGVHDMLFEACDVWLYKYLGGAEGHATCVDNFHAALTALLNTDSANVRVPSPVNLWMNVTVTDNQYVDLRPPVSQVNDTVSLRALVDVVVVMSACPMDLAPVNGADCMPRDVGYRVRRT